MYKIAMIFRNFDGKVKLTFMPNDKNLDLFEAVDRANIYKKRNNKNIFVVLNNENGDVEYEV